MDAHFDTPVTSSTSKLFEFVTGMRRIREGKDYLYGMTVQMSLEEDGLTSNPITVAL